MTDKVKHAMGCMDALGVDWDVQLQVIDQLKELLEQYPKMTKKQITTWIDETFNNVSFLKAWA